MIFLLALYLTWTAPPLDLICGGAPGSPIPVAWYDIERETLSTHEIFKVGSTQNRPDPLILEWCFAQDSPMQREGTSYRYRARAVSILDGVPGDCGPSVTFADVTGNPMACFEDGHETQCFPGAPCRLCPPIGCRTTCP